MAVTHFGGGHFARHQLMVLVDRQTQFSPDPARRALVLFLMPFIAPMEAVYGLQTNSTARKTRHQLIDQL